MNDIICNFNQIMSSFLIQLSPCIGSTYSHQYENIIKYNSLLPLEQFCVHALPVKEKIKNKDKSYFTDPTNHQDKINDNIQMINEILRLGNIYDNLDIESQENVWEIFQALLILSEDYIKIKYSNITIS